MAQEYQYVSQATYSRIKNAICTQTSSRVFYTWNDARIFMRGFMYDQELCENVIFQQEAQHTNQYNRFAEFIQDETNYRITIYQKVD